jgi:hypothetical protein
MADSAVTRKPQAQDFLVFGLNSTRYAFIAYAPIAA